MAFERLGPTMRRRQTPVERPMTSLLPWRLLPQPAIVLVVRLVAWWSVSRHSRVSDRTLDCHSATTNKRPTEARAFCILEESLSCSDTAGWMMVFPQQSEQEQEVVVNRTIFLTKIQTDPHGRVVSTWISTMSKSYRIQNSLLMNKTTEKPLL